jgi:histidine triad (HIT) family protein
MSCLFCNIIAGEIPAKKVYEDEMILAFQDIQPRAEIHLLVIPKKHIDSLTHLQSEDTPVMAYLLSKLPEIAKQQGLKGFRTIINTGKEGGQEVFHLHAHLLGGKGLGGLGF